MKRSLIFLFLSNFMGGDLRALEPPCLVGDLMMGFEDLVLSSEKGLTRDAIESWRVGEESLILKVENQSRREKEIIDRIFAEDLAETGILWRWQVVGDRNRLIMDIKRPGMIFAMFEAAEKIASETRQPLLLTIPRIDDKYRPKSTTFEDLDIFVQDALTNQALNGSIQPLEVVRSTFAWLDLNSRERRQIFLKGLLGSRVYLHYIAPSVARRGLMASDQLAKEIYQRAYHNDLVKPLLRILGLYRDAVVELSRILQNPSHQTRLIDHMNELSYTNYFEHWQRPVTTESLAAQLLVLAKASHHTEKFAQQVDQLGSNPGMQKIYRFLSIHIVSELDQPQ